jgi:hypothetical protein
MTMKIWLSLTLAVVLVHLALMQALFPALPRVQAPASPTFATRTVLLANAPAGPPAQAVAAVPDKPKTKPAQAMTPKPAARTTTRPPPVETDDLVGAMAPAVSAALTLRPVASVPEATPTSAVTPSVPAQETGAAPAIQKAAAFNADALPASVKLVYRVEANKFPFRLRSELLWQQSGLSYQARLSINALGQSRVQTSRGQIDRFGLAPERFSDKSRSEVAAHFNRTQGLVSFSANTPNVPLMPGAQDRLSVLIQLAALVASAPQSFSPGATLSVQTIGPREGDLWLFTFGDMESLELPGGPQQGLKLVRQPRQTYDQKLEVWLAPGLAYMPARIRITEANGDYVDQKWAASERADSP